MRTLNPNPIIMKTSIITSLRVFALALISPIIIATHPALAAADPTMFLQVTPVDHQITITAGDQQTHELTVKNTGNIKIDVSISAKPSGPGSQDTTDPNSSTLNTLANWITFDHQTFTLATQEAKLIRYHISAPPNATFGSQYAAIIVETTGQDVAPDKSGIKSVIQAQSLLYARVTNGAINDIRIETKIPYISISRNLTGAITLHNDGNIEATVKYSFTILPLFSDRSLYQETDKQNLLPNLSKEGLTTHFEWPDTPAFGLFRTITKVSIFDSERETTQLVLVVPLFIVVIFWVAIICLAIALYLAIRHKRLYAKSNPISSRKK
jgi:hypothetical protein